MNRGGDLLARESKNSSPALGTCLSHLEALPNDVGIDILLRLPTADAARFSTVSHRCRILWSLLPILDIHCHSDPPRIASISDALAAHDRVSDISFLSVRLAHLAGCLGSFFHNAAPLITGELSFRNMEYLPQGVDLDNMLHRASREDNGSVDMPCFERALRISARMGFLKLKLPRTGSFHNLKFLYLNCFGSHGQLMVTNKSFPVLQELTIKRAFGIRILHITSDSLLKIRLCKMIGLESFTLSTPNLKVLNVVKCMENALRPETEMEAPKLEVFRWLAPWPSYWTSLSEMTKLNLLNPPVITAFGPEEFTSNDDSVNILRKFPGVRHLELDIDITAYQFGAHSLMQNICFPKADILSLHVKTSGHLSAASLLHVVNMCNTIRVLNVTMQDLTQVRNRCAFNCRCNNPGLEIQSSQMISLREVTFNCLNGMTDEFMFLKALLKVSPMLKKLKLIAGPQFEIVNNKGTLINFLDASKNMHQELEDIKNLIPVGCTLEVYEYVYDHNSDGYVLASLLFDKDEE